MLINKKDITEINQDIGENGLIKNEGSLDYAVNILKGRKGWLYELAHVVRAILVDHVFEDGNKRTTFVLIRLYFEENGFSADKDSINNVILNIVRNAIQDINKIMRLIKRCYQKKK